MEKLISKGINFFVFVGVKLMLGNDGGSWQGKMSEIVVGVVDKAVSRPCVAIVLRVSGHGSFAAIRSVILLKKGIFQISRPPGALFA